MDAVEFLKEYRRMCNQYAFAEGCGEGCSYECALYGEHCDLSCNDMNANDVVFKVEQWSQSHPQKTMMQDFFEKFPNAPKTDVGTPRMCPCDCGYEEVSYCPNNKMCDSLTCWNRSME